MSKPKLPETLEAHLARVLAEIDDIERPGLQETPLRWAKALIEATSGSRTNPNDHVKVFPGDGYDNLIKINHIPFWSTCEHHLSPFWGEVDIEYRPNGGILGLSKFARIVDVFTKRLQTQERITTDICDFLLGCELNPVAVMVNVRAQHSCICSRGVRKDGIETVTTAYRLRNT